jgi:UDP-glucose 4-epimerase
MKKILITGAESYIGVSFEKYLAGFGDAYQVDTVDMRDGAWREKDFSSYDTVFHVAGIAHSDGGKISREREALYYAVNTDLTVEAATKAKAEGVGQFIFMSSAIVYGKSGSIGKAKRITPDTEPSPANCYGDSKLRAEKGLSELSSDSFKVVILRPPMIYGKNCKGNFSTMARIADKVPIFPKVKNERSVLYIDNLSEFIRLMIEGGESGVFFPQNREYMNTSEAIRLLGAAKGKRIRLLRGFTLPLRIMGVFVGFVHKAFGSFTYDAQMSEYKEDYRKVSFEESIAVAFGRQDKV